MKKRILVADDNPENIEMLERKLKRQGFEIKSVVNGLEAVEYLKENQDAVDLIILDLQMPVMDGWGAADKIRNELNLKIPILALSAHIDIPSSIKLRQVGFDDLCGKPVDYTLLTRKLNSLFQKALAS